MDWLTINVGRETLIGYGTIEGKKNENERGKREARDDYAMSKVAKTFGQCFSRSASKVALTKRTDRRFDGSEGGRCL